MFLKRGLPTINPRRAHRIVMFTKPKVMFAKDMLASIVLLTFCQHNKCDLDQNYKHQDTDNSSTNSTCSQTETQLTLTMHQVCQEVWHDKHKTFRRHLQDLSCLKLIVPVLDYD